MSRTVVIHQPDFLPYIGFFHRFLHSDLWVILDNVQFVASSRSWHNRDKIKTPQGEKWITVAVKKSKRDTKINEVMLSTEADWRADNLNLIAQNYRKAPFYAEVFPAIEALYSFECERLVDFNLRSIDMLMGMLGITIERKLASELGTRGKSNELLADIAVRVGADTYLSGLGAKDYYDPAPFERAGVRVVWQDFRHPEYPQMHGDFIPYLSSIDMLFNCGIEGSRRILRSC